MNIQGRGILFKYSHCCCRCCFFFLFTHSFANPGVKKFKERREEKILFIEFDTSKRFLLVVFMPIYLAFPTSLQGRKGTFISDFREESKLQRC